MNVYLILRWVSGVVRCCGITLVLFTTDQKKTVYKGYIDILKVLMFLQRYSSCFFVQSVFLHRYFLCILERVTWIWAVYNTCRYIQRYYQNCEPQLCGRCMGITESSQVCFVSDPPCVVKIPQTALRPSASHLCRCSSFSFSASAAASVLDACIVSWFVFGLEECIHPTWSTYLYYFFVWCDFSLSALFQSVFKDIFPIFVIDYVSHDQNKSQ